MGSLFFSHLKNSICSSRANLFIFSKFFRTRQWTLSKRYMLLNSAIIIGRFIQNNFRFYSLIITFILPIILSFRNFSDTLFYTLPSHLIRQNLRLSNLHVKLLHLSCLISYHFHAARFYWFKQIKHSSTKMR